MEFKISVKEKKKKEKTPFVFDGAENPKEKKLDPQEIRKTEIKKLILENRENFKDLLKNDS